jgi:cell division transport system ATP-binding protein
MIVFSSVSKQFSPDSYALKDVSFEVSAGELILLTGPSGSGKTTVMKLLTKEYNPTNGTILFHKTDLNNVKNSSLHEHRRKIGVVFQDYKLIPELNIWENIALPLSIIGKNESEIEERVTDLLELVSLTDKAMHFPKQLSGGEAQRISIARALSTAPTIVFADEPTGNLDQKNSLLIAKLLSKINELGTTVLFSTHDQDVIELFKKHRHIKLDDGEMISDSNQKESSKDKKDSETKTAKKTQDNEKYESSKISIEDKLKPQKIGFWGSLFGRKEPAITLVKPNTKQELDTKEDQESKDVKEIQEEKTDSKTRKKTKKKNTDKKS